MHEARAQRLQRAHVSRRFLGALGVLATSLVVAASAGAQDPAPPPTDAVASGPSQLSITVITPESSVPTLQERVSSWFTDGTRVSLGVARELPPERIFTSSPREVKVWVVLLSPERALVMFSTAPGPDTARYLLREVRLVSGLDELGLERLASVIHSAFLALREGVEGSERTQVEKALIEAGLLQSAATEPAVPAATAPTAASSSRNSSEVPAASASPERTRSSTPASVLLAAGYALRLRGPEGLGHGPLLSAGLQLPGFASAFDALLSAHLLFGSEFDAGELAATVQTSAFRAHVGFEPALTSRLKLQALLGAGADLARISARVAASASGEQLRPREPGSQWRGALELALGIWWQSQVIDLGVTASATFLLGDVHYSLRADGVEQRLVAPWPVEPGLALQARFRGGP